MKQQSQTAGSFKTSIFTKISTMAKEKGAYNLSQGLPDFDGPKWVQQYACDAILGQRNQSSPAHGLEALRESLSNNYKTYYGINYNPGDEVTICNGATEAIFSTVMALVNPGDEVIVIEPFFDTYIPAIQLAGGVPVTVTLHAPNFELDFDEIKKAFNAKTKLLILNTPHNPSGRVLKLNDLEQLGQIIIENDAYLISDEVYEFLLYDEATHLPPAAIEGLYERTITCSSTGKTFGFTGWRIGWAAAPKEISHTIRMVHQNNTFTAPRPLQEAMAQSLTRLGQYLPEFRSLYQSKRDLLFDGLNELGFKPLKPESTYFIMTPIKQLTDKNDIDFAMELIEKAGVAAIPPSAFYNKTQQGSGYLRFCFAKEDQTLKGALKNLRSHLQ